jgi:hypothetical protein
MRSGHAGGSNATACLPDPIPHHFPPVFFQHFLGPCPLHLHTKTHTAHKRLPTHAHAYAPLPPLVLTFLPFMISGMMSYRQAGSFRSYSFLTSELYTPAPPCSSCAHNQDAGTGVGSRRGRARFPLPSRHPCRTGAQARACTHAHAAHRSAHLQVLFRAPLLARVAPRPRRGHAPRYDGRAGDAVARLGHSHVNAVHHVAHALALRQPGKERGWRKGFSGRGAEHRWVRAVLDVRATRP